MQNAKYYTLFMKDETGEKSQANSIHNHHEGLHLLARLFVLKYLADIANDQSDIDSEDKHQEIKE